MHTRIAPLFTSTTLKAFVRVCKQLDLLDEPASVYVRTNESSDVLKADRNVSKPHPICFCSETRIYYRKQTIMTYLNLSKHQFWGWKSATG